VSKLLFKLACFLCGQFLIITSFGQDWVGYNSFRSAGIYSIQRNPARAARTPFKYDVAILGAQFDATNTAVFDDILGLFNDDPFPFLQNDDEFLIDANIQFPSILYAINERSGFAVEFKLRANFFTEASDTDLIDILKNSIDNSLLGLDFSSEFITGRTHGWWELGFTYAHQLWTDQQHYLDGGITLKLNSGFAAGYINVDNLAFRLINKDLLADLSGNVQLIYNRELQEFIDDGKLKILTNLTPSLSLGFHYGYKPYYAKNEKFSIDFSLIDLGRIKYSPSTDSREYLVNTNQLELGIFRSLDGLDELSDSFEDLFGESEQTRSEYIMSLPLKFILQADYNLSRNLYLNTLLEIAVRGRNRNVESTKNLNEYQLVPRYEKRKWGIGIPLSYNSIAGFRTGLSAAWGPVFIGSSNIFNAMIGGSGIEQLTFMIGFKFSKRWPLPNSRPANFYSPR